MAINNTALENGNSFSHKDGKLLIAGNELPSCTEFKGTVTAPVTMNPGMGESPTSYGKESKTTEGSFTVDQKDLVKLGVALSPTGMLTDALPVPGVFLQENNVGDKNGYAWTGMFFENDGVETSVGNTQTLMTITFKCVNLKRTLL